MRTTTFTIWALAIAIATVFHLWPESLSGWAGVATVPDSSMEPSYQSGDVLLLRRAPVYEPGDVVAFRAPRAEVVARVVDGNPVTGYVLRGDDQMLPYPTRPDGSVIIGRVTAELQPTVGAVARGLAAVPTSLLAAALGATATLWTPERLRRLQARRAAAQAASGGRDRWWSDRGPSRPSPDPWTAPAPRIDLPDSAPGPATATDQRPYLGWPAPAAPTVAADPPQQDGWSPPGSWPSDDVETAWGPIPDTDDHGLAPRPSEPWATPAVQFRDAPLPEHDDPGEGDDGRARDDARPDELEPASVGARTAPDDDVARQGPTAADDQPAGGDDGGREAARHAVSPRLARALAVAFGLIAIVWSFNVLQLLQAPTTFVVDTADTATTRVLAFELVTSDDDAPADDPAANRSIRPEPVFGWLDADGAITPADAVETVGTVPFVDSQLDRDEVDVLVATVAATADRPGADPVAVGLDVGVRGATAPLSDLDDAVALVPTDDGSSAGVRVDLGQVERGLGGDRVYEVVLTPSVELESDPQGRGDAADPIEGEALVVRVVFDSVELDGAMATSIRVASGPAETRLLTASVLGLDMRIGAARVVSSAVLALLLALVGLAMWSGFLRRPSGDDPLAVDSALDDAPADADAEGPHDTVVDDAGAGLEVARARDAEDPATDAARDLGPRGRDDDLVVTIDLDDHVLVSERHREARTAEHPQS